MEKPKLSRRDFIKVSAVTAFAGGVAARTARRGLVKSPVKQAGPEVKVIPGLCFECHRQCLMLNHIRDGRVIKVEGSKESFNTGALCAKGPPPLRTLEEFYRLSKHDGAESCLPRADGCYGVPDGWASHAGGFWPHALPGAVGAQRSLGTCRSNQSDHDPERDRSGCQA